MMTLSCFRTFWSTVYEQTFHNIPDTYDIGVLHDLESMFLCVIVKYKLRSDINIIFSKWNEHVWKLNINSDDQVYCSRKRYVKTRVDLCFSIDYW